jgi:hypothetical protein
LGRAPATLRIIHTTQTTKKTTPSQQTRTTLLEPDGNIPYQPTSNRLAGLVLSRYPSSKKPTKKNENPQSKKTKKTNNNQQTSTLDGQRTRTRPTQSEQPANFDLMTGNELAFFQPPTILNINFPFGDRRL